MTESRHDSLEVARELIRSDGSGWDESTDPKLLEVYLLKAIAEDLREVRIKTDLILVNIPLIGTKFSVVDKRNVYTCSLGKKHLKGSYEESQCPHESAQSPSLDGKNG